MHRLGTGRLLRPALILVLVLAAPVPGPRTGPAGARLPLAVPRDSMRLPPVMLWAWERPADLRFLDTRRAGVAFLAGTVEIRSAGATVTALPEQSVVYRPRLDPLAVPPGTALMAVVRIETPNDLWHRQGLRPAEQLSPGPTSLYSKAQRLRVADMIAAAAALAGVRAVQVDYDATLSERPFYRLLLEDARRRLAPGMPLSITALASWCIGDPWLNSLPRGTLDEAVPMLFRMGPAAADVAAFVESGAPFRVAACGGSWGLSTDEVFSRALLSGAVARDGGGKAGRIYAFSAGPWTKPVVDQILREVARWDDKSGASR